MKHRTRLTAIVGLFLIGSGSIANSDSIRSGTPDEPAMVHELIGGSLRQRVRVYLGIALFERAELSLPPLRIFIHEDEAGCDGHGGLFNRDGSGNRIDVCRDLIRHELAHAYTHHNLTDGTRAAYIAHTNLPTWSDPSFRHSARAVERAANTIAWNVGLEHLDADGAATYARFLEEYELLTGRRSPRVGRLVRQVRETVTIHGASAADVDLIESQLVVFANAGLQLPQLNIYVHTDRSGCAGFLGMFSTYNDPHRIDVCVLNDAVVRHELAHAWERHNVTDEQRKEFMSLVGLDAWFDNDIEHSERGVERAALIISWGIKGDALSNLERLFFADMLDQYEVLVGEPSPRL